MDITYKECIENQDIDINKLRPKKSYDYLIANRDHALKELLNEKGCLPGNILEDRFCPSCAAEKNSMVFSKDYFTGVKCDNCDLIFVNPVLKEEVTEKIYKSNEYKNIVKQLGEESHVYRKERFGNERINNIEQFYDAKLPKKLLEIGCSTGFLLEAAQERGWDALGLELNQSAVDFGSKRGLKIVNKSLDKIDFKDEKFSVIALYDVLEHLVYPDKMIKKLNNLLFDGGTIFVYVPNFQSATKELIGIDNAHFIWPTHHLTYFTPVTLKAFLENYGFKTLFWETQGLDLEDWLWYLKEKTAYDTELIEKNKFFFQFVVNASGYGKNLRMYARKVANA